jgi:hypothetical protein
MMPSPVWAALSFTAPVIPVAPFRPAPYAAGLTAVIIFLIIHSQGINGRAAHRNSRRGVCLTAVYAPVIRPRCEPGRRTGE